jgi:DNA polymerase I
MTKYAIIDCNYLCHRSFHRLSDLSYEEMKTGVIFGFFNSILHIANKLKTKDFIFCWDSKSSYRKKDNTAYKAGRTEKREVTPEQKESYELAFAQFDSIRKEILPALGFHNVFMQDGIEADDLIAWTVKNLDMSDSYIVSADNDLWQLLHQVRGIYQIDKKTILTEMDFIDAYGIFPNQWPEAKAIAGDRSDNILGVEGVGIKTAVRFLKNEKIPKSKLTSIWGNKQLKEDNLKLIVLPYSKTQQVNLNGGDKLDIFQFENICFRLGFRSFLQKDKFNEWCRAFGLL